jgi:hypothetical protein
MPVHHPGSDASAPYLLSCCQVGLPLPTDAEHGSFEASELLPTNSHTLLLRSPYMNNNREAITGKKERPATSNKWEGLLAASPRWLSTSSLVTADAPPEEELCRTGVAARSGVPSRKSPRASKMAV